MNFLGNLLRQQLCYPSKLHGKGHHRTMLNLSGWRRRGWEAALCAGWELGDTCGNHSHLKMPWCGQGTNHISPCLVVFLPEMYLSSRARRPKAEEDINQKKPVFERCDCSAHTFLLSEHKLTWGMIKQARSCLQIYFSFFSISANPPQQNINLLWETSFKHDISVQR